MDGLDRITCSGALVLLASVLVVLLAGSPDSFALAPKSHVQDDDEFFGSAQSLELAVKIYHTHKQDQTGSSGLVDFRRMPGWLDTFENRLFWNGVLYIPRSDRMGGGYVRIRDQEGADAGLDIQILPPPDRSRPEATRRLFEGIGRRYLAQENYPQALRAFYYSGDEDVHLEECYLRAAHAADQPAEKAHILIELGRWKLGRGQWDSATAVFEQAGRLVDAQRWEAKLGRFFSCIRKKEFSQARKVLGAVYCSRTMPVESPGHFFYSAFSQMSEQKYSDAVTCLATVISWEPKNTHAWGLLAQALERQGQRGKAQWIRRWVSHGPTDLLRPEYVRVFFAGLDGKNGPSQDEFFAPETWTYNAETDLYSLRRDPTVAMERGPTGYFRQRVSSPVPSGDCLISMGLPHGMTFSIEARKILRGADVRAEYKGTYILHPGTETYTRFLRFLLDELEMLRRTPGPVQAASATLSDAAGIMGRLTSYLERKAADIQSLGIWREGDTAGIADLLQGSGNTVAARDVIPPESVIARTVELLPTYSDGKVRANKIGLRRVLVPADAYSRAIDCGDIVVSLDTGAMHIGLKHNLMENGAVSFRGEFERLNLLRRVLDSAL